jgi:tRNA dimethylallyltransferase
MNAAGNKKTVIVVCGPTASGKTAWAIRLAKHFLTEIISADSRQCFRELNIGVARPSEAELKTIPHHFVATHSIHEPVSAGTFENYALEKTREIFTTHDTLILTGGTGLYIRAFTEGMDDIPDVPADIRDNIIRGFEKYGLLWLQQQVLEADPQFFQSGEIRNPQRLMRALEVKQTTGQSILSFRTGKKTKRDFRIIKVGLGLPKDELRRNIQARTEKMIESGLVEEVRSLLPYKNLNALQTVGYQEIFEYLEGKTSLPEAVEKINIHTAQYAKRQMTWFRKDKMITWFHPADAEKIIAYCKEMIR